MIKRSLLKIKPRLFRSPWSWIPSLYFAEGLPYIIVMFVATDMYKTLNVPNASLAFWTSILYLPWVVKPLWSPFVDLYSTKRKWILWTQFGLALSFIGLALTLQLPWWFPASLILLWLMAFISATHDIAADGFYMLGLSEHQQAFFTGIRSTFYRLAMIAGMGALVILTGWILDQTGLDTVRREVVVARESGPAVAPPPPISFDPDQQTAILIYPEQIRLPLDENNPDSAVVYLALSAPPENDEPVEVRFGFKKGNQDIYLDGKTLFQFDRTNWNQYQKTLVRIKPGLNKDASAIFIAQSGAVALSWSISISILGLLFLLIMIYHFFALPKPAPDNIVPEEKEGSDYWKVFSGFFRKKGIVGSLVFLLFYRFAESQLSKMASPFLLDSRENGGLSLTLAEKGFAYGTVGLIALLLGGISGGILASRNGLKKWMWWMALAINLPNLAYVYLAYTQPTSLWIVNACIAIEQFGYGFGFTGYMLYMLYIAGKGKYQTAHFAIATGFMALGMMVPGMFSGAVEEFLGYQQFFIYIVLCTIPSFLTLFAIKIDPFFGKKTPQTHEP